MELSSSRKDTISWNPNVSYWVQNILILAPILSQIIPVHTTPFYFSKIHSIVLFSPLHLGLPNGLFHSGFPTKILFFVMHATCHAFIVTHYVLHTEPQ
jgi:hypothetical protein